MGIGAPHSLVQSSMRRLVVVTLLLLTRVVLAKGGPPSAPMLVVETGMHTGLIKRVAVDAAGLWLVTAGEDKTARVWDLHTGVQVRVLRPPIDKGDEGKLFAVAMSPDGKLVAAGGWTGFDWDGETSIYLFDRATGVMVRRFAGLPQVINHIAFSFDGQRLAAATAEKGIRVYRIEDGSEVGRDLSYSGGSYGLSFDKDGRLVTACDDGYVRLYDPQLHQLAKVHASGGREPYSVQFSPDGRKIAVGYDDATKVDVLSSTDLSVLYRPDTKGVTRGDLSKVAWSTDGKQLYAGGRRRGRSWDVRRWDDGGRGPSIDLDAATHAVVDMSAVPQGLVFGADDPAWGLIDTKGNGQRYVASPKVDFRGSLKHFQISADGQRVRFPYEPGGQHPAIFSVADRALLPDAPGEAMLSAAQSNDDVGVTDWEDSTSPMVDDQPLALAPYEVSRSVALTPDGESLVLGGEWSLRLFSVDGEERWNVPVPGAAWSVNVTADSRLIVAAYGDGTVRWHRASDGVELLAFFPHADRKRWAAWTPSGYYDASVGGEELLGWHVNHGRDQAAEFVPVSHLREKFHRPDIVSLVLRTLNEQQAIDTANKR
jgi:WD40 repeat protein